MSATCRQLSPAHSSASTLIELGASVDLTYQVTFNGLAIDPGPMRYDEAFRALSALPGVKAVYADYAHQPDLYASLPLINAAAAWNNAAIGGKSNAGAGVKVASMDGGAHKDAPMFDGTGYSYPPDFPALGLGLTANNNGKIIASRAYFRTWDPPSVGDENPWPGVNGTPHGTHTASTAAGNEVVADYLGITMTISGVAPKAWIMSYRVFYNSITNDGSFYNAEGIAALEDIMMDGADVLNNSWGGGPGSVGGEFDPLDIALINVANAGTFVSMSAGNAGPNKGTGDHPSDAYISVAASSTAGTLASGRLSVTAPTPVPATLQDMPFSMAGFGASLAPGGIYPYLFVPAVNVDPANVNGCNPWPAGTFTGKAALISRGTCEFGLKVLNAEQAGAEAVLVYNNVGGGDTLINMAPGVVGNQVTIPSAFIWYSKGTAMIAWYNTNGAASEFALDTVAYQAGNTPDIIASFSSRGPGVGNVLKPDIAAPGVNILAQGYTPGATGEARHLGWGQASGTSMAAPHVTGAAALLRQIHPSWTNAEIKSALMSTSKFMGIYNGDGTPAQPLDMGAGRLDLTNAANPGVILDPPSVSFGQVITGAVETRHVMLTSVASATETYDLSTVMLAGSAFTYTVEALPGFDVSPAQITLTAGASAMVTVTLDTAASAGFGDNQGYIVMDGAAYDAHMPVWARVAPLPGADVLLVDADVSELYGTDYLSYYTDTLDNLGLTYDVLNWSFADLPDATTLSAYAHIIIFTGDNYQYGLNAAEQDGLTEYANAGGKLFVMGQDLASAWGALSTSTASYFYGSVLGGVYLGDSVSGYSLPSLPVSARTDGPSALQGINIDLSGPQEQMVTLTGAKEVPEVATDMFGEAWFAYNVVSQQLDFYVEVTSPVSATLTASHIHDGAAGVNGPVLYSLYAPATPVEFIGTTSFQGSVSILPAHVLDLLSGDLYINVHTTAHPGGEIRAQVEVAANGDGAANQYYIDEIRTRPNVDPVPVGNTYPYQALLQYAGPFNVEQGTVAMSHRDQPVLENPGLAYLGRSIYTTFGLEGVNNGMDSASREDVLAAFVEWAMDEPVATIADTSIPNESNLTMFTATLASNVAGVTGVSYRWDFGDGSGYTPAFTSREASHVYATCGVYTVRVEATDTWGNKAIGVLDAPVTDCETNSVFMPIIGVQAPGSR